MSFILSVGPWGGFYHSLGKASWRLCLGWVALTIIAKDIDPVLRAGLGALEKTNS